MGEPAEILLVDDEPALRELMKVALGTGYRFAEAGDLDAALDLVRSRVPSVVLLDLMLPGGSGFDLLRAVREEPGLADVRVVVVSAWQSPEDRRAGDRPRCRRVPRQAVPARRAGRSRG